MNTVGGSKGAKSMVILKRHPHLQALAADRARTFENAADFGHGREAGDCLSSRRFEVSNVFASYPMASSPKDAEGFAGISDGTFGE